MLSMLSPVSPAVAPGAALESAWPVLLSATCDAVTKVTPVNGDGA
jgi:hypothetical protein